MTQCCASGIMIIIILWLYIIASFINNRYYGSILGIHGLCNAIRHQYVAKYCVSDSNMTGHHALIWLNMSSIICIMHQYGSILCIMYIYYCSILCTIAQRCASTAHWCASGTKNMAQCCTSGINMAQCCASSINSSMLCITQPRCNTTNLFTAC